MQREGEQPEREYRENEGRDASLNVVGCESEVEEHPRHENRSP